jgi:hypothetical protein
VLAGVEREMLDLSSAAPRRVHSDSAQGFGRPPAEKPAAQLVARLGVAVEQQRLRALAGERDRGRRTRPAPRRGSAESFDA